MTWDVSDVPVAEERHPRTAASEAVGSIQPPKMIEANIR